MDIMETKEVNKIFYAIGSLEAENKCVVDQDGKKHPVTLKEVIGWLILRKYPMDAEEFTETYMEEVDLDKLGIYMDAHEAERLIERLLCRGLVVMGVGEER